MKWFDDPNLQYGSSGTAKSLVRANYRIHHLESRLRRANKKAARLHRLLKKLHSVISQKIIQEL